ncbi:hypothetical protein LBMAG24_24350 [Bacteroidota bacterium]|nr:hypothetical protein LBMAG24_24350 [Bacteroidota bacterium]
MEATCINNLPTQTNDVMDDPENPVNPDSNPAFARIISTEELVLAVTLIMHTLEY